MVAARNFNMMGTTAQVYIVVLPDDTTLDILLPHELYPSVVGGDLSQWCLAPAAVAAERGVGSVLRTWAAHPDVQFTGDLSHVGILGFHCDGVQYTASVRAGSGKSVLVASVNVVSGADDRRRMRRIPLFVLQKARLCKRRCGGFCTLQAIFAVVAWSLRCLLQGRAPTCRHDGRDFTGYDNKVRLAGGSPITPAALLQVRGDWEGLVQFFRLRSWSSEHFCWMCDCTLSAGAMSYKDFTPEAAHRGTQISHESYMLSCAATGDQPSNIFRCPGLTINHLVVDSMHAADLGTFGDAFGSLFHLEISDKVWFRTNELGMVQLNKSLRQYYVANKDKKMSKITPLSMSQIPGKHPKYPFLKAKAAQTRHLAEFGLILANLHKHGSPDRVPFDFPSSHMLAGRTEEHLDLLVSRFQGMSRYVRSLGAIPFVEDECRQSMYLYLQSMAGLHSLWRPGGLEEATTPFVLRQKTHVLQHLVEDHVPRYGNLASFWCYRDEHFVGSVKAPAFRTRHPFTMESRVMQKLQLVEGVSARI